MQFIYYKQLFTYYLHGCLGCLRDTCPWPVLTACLIHGPVNTSVAMTVSPPVTSATEQGFWAEGDNLCAKDAVKFLHDSDDYSFDDSFDYRIDFTIASIVLTY